MRLGVLADVHGNRVALEAVVADAAAVGVERWWVLGDLVAIGPEPVATLELVAELAAVEVTSGNTERYTLTGERPPARPDDAAEVDRSFVWTQDVVTAAGWSGWLAALPAEVRATLPDGTRLLGVHAVPGRDDGAGITPHRPDHELAVDLAGADADVVLAGHTHQPADRLVGAIRAVNGGSLSNPVTSDLRAGYVVIHADEHGHRVEHRRVAYDVDRFLGRVARSGHPAAGYIASFQRGERLVGR